MALRTIYGIVGPTGSIVSGSGFAVSRTNNGEYQVQFNAQFSRIPAVVGSQVLFGNEDEDTRDNVIFPFLNTNGFTAITGDSGGSHKDRNFAFTVVGE